MKAANNPSISHSEKKRAAAAVVDAAILVHALRDGRVVTQEQRLRLIELLTASPELTETLFSALSLEIH